MGSSLLTAAALPHYVAPITTLLYVGVGAGMLGLHRRARSRGEVNPVPILLLIIIAAALLNGAQEVRSQNEGFPLERESVRQEILDIPGRHLVLVSYGPGHNVHREWVYNRADIDGARIVWARSMDAASDRRLREYFSDRSVWCLEVDQEPLLSASQLHDRAVGPCSFH